MVTQNPVVGVQGFRPIDHDFTLVLWPCAGLRCGGMHTTFITGATSGIGRAAALYLSREGHHIVVAGRSRDRGVSLVSEIEGSGGSGSFLQVDLGSFESVRRAAKEFRDRSVTID